MGLTPLAGASLSDELVSNIAVSDVEVLTPDDWQFTHADAVPDFGLSLDC